jgi:hypothetical protein
MKVYVQNIALQIPNIAIHKNAITVSYFKGIKYTKTRAGQ